MSEIKLAGIINGVKIDDTFAEAFDMAATGLIITAPTAKWAEIAARTMTGFATSVIACGVEAGLDRELSPEETPDGRPGFRVLLFGFAVEGLKDQVLRRVGQCVLTSPGSAVFSGMDGGEKIAVGSALRYFGDGNQASKRLGKKRYWRIPVMDGEFLAEHSTGSTAASIGGGNILILARSHAECLAAAESAVEAALSVPDVILPFPGGMVRSGSKVGSKYKALVASTNNAFCPNLRGDAGNLLEADTEAVLELVMDGLSFEAIRESMKRAVQAVVSFGSQRGIQRISAGNYGGNLGRHHFHLKELI